MSQSIILNIRMSCVVGISEFGFDKECRYLKRMDIKTIPTFESSLIIKNQHQGGNNTTNDIMEKC